MGSTGLERRRELEDQVQQILDTHEGGYLQSAVETPEIDFKEEAGRRVRGSLEPGQRQNQAAATKLADEVACFANTPGGGALIVGVEDETGRLIGTQLDESWLRHTIHSAVDVAPEVVAHIVGGQRIVAIYIAEAPTAVEDTSDRLRWRVGDHCVPVDRSEWWLQRRKALEVDVMAAESSATPEDMTDGALRILRESGGEDEAHTEPRELLRRIGVLREGDRLSQAGQLLFTQGDRVYLEFVSLDVPGGYVTNRVVPRPEESLLEQIRTVQMALNVANDHRTVEKEFVHRQVRRVPEAAAREAVLNGMIHRDWDSAEPTEVRWIDLDSALEVRSPGGFTGGVTAENILAGKHARYPALSDAFRALGMVEKQGLGVDRMYQAMIAVGHRPPHIAETPGPHVETVLAGGDPVYPVLELVESIRPGERQRDPRIALILHHLLHHAFIDIPTAGWVLQKDPHGAELALQVAAQTTVGDSAMIVPYRDVWCLSSEIRTYSARLERQPGVPEFFAYASTAAGDIENVIREWLKTHTTVSTREVAEVAGVSRPTVQTVINSLVGVELEKVGGGPRTAYRYTSQP